VRLEAFGLLSTQKQKADSSLRRPTRSEEVNAEEKIGPLRSE
jgi:hypothetical protein